MKKQFCPYCGLPLSEECECEKLAAEDALYMRDELEERQLINAGQQDIIDMYRFER